MVNSKTNLVDYWRAKIVDDQNETLMQKIKKENEPMAYFNYNLTPDVWNLLVNKQIYMTFERLFLEKQLVEKNKKESEMIAEIESLVK